MIDHVQKVLKDIKRVVPDYDPKQGYELAGFVWFQGFNDLVDGWTYHEQMKPGGYDLYAELLGHLIRDVRKDLSAPKMPFVIGVMGIGGEKEGKKAPQMHFRQAQAQADDARRSSRGTWWRWRRRRSGTTTWTRCNERMEKLNGKLDREFKKDPKLTREAKEEARKKAIDEQFKPEELKRLKAASPTAATTTSGRPRFWPRSARRSPRQSSA